jgi:hypothetical protein
VPPAAIAAVKRHPLYRRIHCHIAGSCPEDGWQEAESGTTFVVFAINSAHGAPAFAGFAVTGDTAVVINARLLVRGREGLWSKPLESLVPCGHSSAGVEESSLPLTGLGMISPGHDHTVIH